MKKYCEDSNLNRLLHRINALRSSVNRNRQGTNGQPGSIELTGRDLQKMELEVQLNNQ